MRILLSGDTHGNINVLVNKIELAKSYGASMVIVLGDFGLWPGYEGVFFLDKVNEAARANSIRVVALPGNHEDHPQWDKWFHLAPKDGSGFAYIRSNILLTEKVHSFKLDGKRFFVCGGAVSIDKQWRIEGQSWWRNETFSEQDLASVEKYKGPPVDFLLTHDCSNYTPWRTRLKPDMDSMMNRERIDRAIKTLRPKYHFHGHMHTKYEWENYHSHAGEMMTKTYGLECDGEHDSWVILDTGADRTRVDGSATSIYWPTQANYLIPK